MRMLSQATFLLEQAISTNASLNLLVESTKAMEYSYLHEPKDFWPESLLKNLVKSLLYHEMDPINVSFRD